MTEEHLEDLLQLTYEDLGHSGPEEVDHVKIVSLMISSQRTIIYRMKFHICGLEGLSINIYVVVFLDGRILV